MCKANHSALIGDAAHSNACQPRRHEEHEDSRREFCTLESSNSYRGNVNAYNVSPAPTTTYWRPSSMYVSGPLLVLMPRPTCHNGLPFSGSYATKLPPPSLPNSSLPAVLSKPE